MNPFKPKISAEQRSAMAVQQERERQLRIEKAREGERSMQDQVAFRRRLRGVTALLSKGFQGFADNSKLG